MSGLRLMARWYLRAARILWRRAMWRRSTRRRTIVWERVQRTLPSPQIADNKALALVATKKIVPMALPPRKINPLMDTAHPCPRCDSRSHYLAARLRERKGVWDVSCRRCDYHWSIPVEYRDEQKVTA